MDLYCNMEELIKLLKDSIKSVITFKETEDGIDWTAKFNTDLVRRTQFLSNYLRMKFEGLVSSSNVNYVVTHDGCYYDSKSLTLSIHLNNPEGQFNLIKINLMNSWSSKQLLVMYAIDRYDEYRDTSHVSVMKVIINGDVKNWIEN